MTIWKLRVLRVLFLFFFLYDFYLFFFSVIGNKSEFESKEMRFCLFPDNLFYCGLSPGKINKWLIVISVNR